MIIMMLFIIKNLDKMITFLINLRMEVIDKGIKDCDVMTVRTTRLLKDLNRMSEIYKDLRHKVYDAVITEGDYTKDN